MRGLDSAWYYWGWYKGVNVRHDGPTPSGFASEAIARLDDPGATKVHDTAGATKAAPTAPAQVAIAQAGTKDVPTKSRWIYFDWGVFGNYYYDMGKSLVTGEAGAALGERAVQIVENNSGESFTGTTGDWLRFSQLIGGELTGGNAFVEGSPDTTQPANRGSKGSIAGREDSEVAAAWFCRGWECSPL